MATILRQEQHDRQWHTWVEGDANNSIMVITGHRIDDEEAELVQANWLSQREEANQQVEATLEEYKTALELAVAFIKDEKLDKASWGEYIETLPADATKAIALVDAASERKDKKTP